MRSISGCDQRRPSRRSASAARRRRGGAHSADRGSCRRTHSGRRRHVRHSSCRHSLGRQRAVLPVDGQWQADLQTVHAIGAGIEARLDAAGQVVLRARPAMTDNMNQPPPTLSSVVVRAALIAALQQTSAACRSYKSSPIHWKGDLIGPGWIRTTAPRIMRAARQRCFGSRMRVSPAVASRSFQRVRRVGNTLGNTDPTCRESSEAALRPEMPSVA
jgi:hypothetical protein